LGLVVLKPSMVQILFLVLLHQQVAVLVVLMTLLPLLVLVALEEAQVAQAVFKQLLVLEHLVKDLLVVLLLLQPHIHQAVVVAQALLD
jgi:hypothetical protein